MFTRYTAGFMAGVGTTALGMCRRACKLCTPCSKRDWECINRNRKRGGFLELDEQEMGWLGVKYHHEDPMAEL
jgi:hypothetical protein